MGGGGEGEGRAGGKGWEAGNYAVVGCAVAVVDSPPLLEMEREGRDRGGGGRGMGRRRVGEEKEKEMEEKGVKGEAQILKRDMVEERRK